MGTSDTRANFINAFWKLYEKKPIEKISINELCRTAGYNRSTFYAHYENIYDLLERAINVMFVPIREKLFEAENFYEVLCSGAVEGIFFEAFESKNRYIQILFKRNHHWLFGEKVKNEIMKMLKKHYQGMEDDFQRIEILLEYHIEAVIGMMRYWFNNREKITEKDFVKMVYEIASRGVLELMVEEIGALEEPSAGNKKDGGK